MAIRYPTNYNSTADIPADLEDMAESIQDELDLKVDKVTGKGLSTEDYTSAEKSKLNGIATGAEVNVIETVKVNGTALVPSNKEVDVPVPTKTSDLTNDSGFGTYTKPSGGIPKTDLASAVQTSLEKADSAVQDVSGKEDKSNKVTSISSSSTNTQYPSAKVVYDELKEKQDEIDALVEENSTLKKQIPTEHISTTSIQLTNSAEGLPIENVAIWGATSQDSYNGYNIFNINEISNSSSNEISLSVNGNNITLSGTATAGAFIIFNLTNPISLSNGDSLTLSKTAVAEVTGQTILRDASNNSIVKLNHNALSTTYTATADITLTILVFYVSNGVTINYTFKLQIEKNSTNTD